MLAVKRQVVVTSRIGVRGNRWDIMAKLIIIFAGVEGKVRARRR